MALPSSGAISMSQVNVELGKASNAAISMNDAAVRSLAGVASGAISMSNLLGKSSVAEPTLALSVTGNGQMLSTSTKYAYINCTLGGTSPTTSCVRISGSVFTLTKMSNTQYRIGTVGNGSCARYSAVYRVTATNSAGSVTKDTTVYFDDYCDTGASCFTGDSLVTMWDGSYKRIDEIQPGDLVKTPFGYSEVDWIRLPVLGSRPLLAMNDGKCKTSGEHCLWSKNAETGVQWWATRDIEWWRYEAANNMGPGLNGIEPMAYDFSGRATFATENGWVDSDWSVVEDAPADTQLYHLYLKDHASYFVDGYLVIGELPRLEASIDWTQFNWDSSLPRLPVYMQYDYDLTPVDRAALSGFRIEQRDMEE